MIIQTADLKPSETPPAVHQVYNGLDSCLTLEIFQALESNADNPIYAFERALQAPALDMMLRGWKVDRGAAISGVSELNKKIDRLTYILQTFASVIWDKTFKDKDKNTVSLNPASPAQLKEFLYEAMRLPVQYKNDKGVKKPSVDREALEKLDDYLIARPILSCILQIRDLVKQREVFQTEIDNDGRMRYSFNIAGTVTGRPSSSASSEDTGRNIFNIDADLRHIFVADKGWKLCGIDLEQAESREVGWLHGILFDDWRYLDACYAGDLHTTVAKMVWPNLPWTGNKKFDREIAETPFYRGLDYRFMCKKLGHGSNYGGKPYTLAKHAKIEVKLCTEFQEKYFEAFPAMPQWHEWVREQLEESQSLTTPWGRTRHFFGRPNDDSTLREAIAYSPQSSTAERMNLGLWRIWKYMLEVKLLATVYDAVYFLYKEEEENIVIPKALSLIDIRLTHNRHELIVPGECKLGFNWGAFSDENDVKSGKATRINLAGLKKWKPK